MTQLDLSENILLEKEKRKFKELLSNVLEEDWLEVKSRMEGEWEFVELKNKYEVVEFDNVSFTSSSSGPKDG